MAGREEELVGMTWSVTRLRHPQKIVSVGVPFGGGEPETKTNHDAAASTIAGAEGYSSSIC
jgi:hypothetical protein